MGDITTALLALALVIAVVTALAFLAAEPLRTAPLSRLEQPRGRHQLVGKRHTSRYRRIWARRGGIAVKAFFGRLLLASPEVIGVVVGATVICLGTALLLVVPVVGLVLLFAAVAGLFAVAYRSAPAVATPKPPRIKLDESTVDARFWEIIGDATNWPRRPAPRQRMGTPVPVDRETVDEETEWKRRADGGGDE